MKSRVKGDFQARFRENVMVKVHGVTRLGSIQKKRKESASLDGNSRNSRKTKE